MSLKKYRYEINKLLEELILIDYNLGNNVKNLVTSSDLDDLMKYYMLNDVISVCINYLGTMTDGPKEDIDKSNKIVLVLKKMQLFIFNEENKEISNNDKPVAARDALIEISRGIEHDER